MLPCPFRHLISTLDLSAELYPIASPRAISSALIRRIEWVWIVQAKRYATKKEIANLCAGKPVKIPAILCPVAVTHVM